MLTKFPQRLAEFEFPETCGSAPRWTLRPRVATTERAMANAKAAVKWVSVEPMLDPIAMDFSISSGRSRRRQFVVPDPGVEAAAEMGRRSDRPRHGAGCAVYHRPI